jgi:hypothetical protein
MGLAWLEKKCVSGTLKMRRVDSELQKRLEQFAKLLKIKIRPENVVSA